MSLRIPLCVPLLAATLLQASHLAGAEFGNVPRTRQHVDMVLPPELDSTAVAAQTPEYDYWTVQVTLNGQKLRLVVDTGAEATFLSPKAAMKCGLKDAFGHGFESPPGGFQRVAANPAKIARMDVGAITVSNLEALVCDLQAPDWIEGLLGTDLFTQFLVEFDPERGRIVFWNSTKFRDPPDAAILPLRASGSPVVLTTEVRIGEISVPAMLDTGHPGFFVLTPGFFQAHRLEEIGEKIPFPPELGRLSHEGECLQLRSVTFGKWKLEKVPGVLPRKENRFGQLPVSAALCGALLSRYHCYYDLPKGRLLVTALTKAPVLGSARPSSPGVSNER